MQEPGTAFPVSCFLHLQLMEMSCFPLLCVWVRWLRLNQCNRCVK